MPKTRDEILTTLSRAVSELEKLRDTLEREEELAWLADLTARFGLRPDSAPLQVESRDIARLLGGDYTANGVGRRLGRIAELFPTLVTSFRKSNVGAAQWLISHPPADSTGSIPSKT